MNPNPRRNRYVVAMRPEHPRANSKGRVLEHILVAEKALGRFLPRKHPVHHADENGKNNVPSNIVICEDEHYHQLLHRRMRAREATGDPNALPCNICGQFDMPANMRVFLHRRHDRPNGTVRAYHTVCKTNQNNRNLTRRQTQASGASR